MLSYCLKCRKNTGSIVPKVSATSKCRTMILSNALYVALKNLLKSKKQKDY